MLGSKKQRAPRTRTHNKLVEDNLGLIGFVIDKYFGSYARNEYYGRQDMFQDGALGLARASESYKEDLGKFSTYATHWIRLYISYGLTQSGFTGVRLPHYVYNLKASANKKKIKKSRLAAHLGIALLEKAATAFVSLDADTGQGDTLANKLSDPKNEAKDLYEKDEYDFLVECVRTELRDICASTKEPLKNYSLFLDRFGINEAGVWYSYAALGKKYSMSAAAANYKCNQLVTKIRKRVAEFANPSVRRAQLRGTDEV